MIRLHCILPIGALTFATLIAPSPAHADIVVGPRFSYYFDNSNLRTSAQSADQIDGPTIDAEATEVLRNLFGSDEIMVSSTQEGSGVLADQITFPMYGAMANFGDDRDRFTVTAMYGQGNGSLSQIFSQSSSLKIADTTVLDVATLSAEGTVSINKYDLELTWQRRTSEQFAFFAGARYERLESASGFSLRLVGTRNIEAIISEGISGEPPPAADRAFANTAIGESRATLETFSVRAGVTVFVPFADNSVLFANGMMHASYQPDYSVTDRLFDDATSQTMQDTSEVGGETSLGPDIAVGAQFILSDALALDVRYRAILFFPLTGEASFGDARVNHGVNLGLSLRL